MKKRIIIALLCLVLILSMATPALGAMSLSNFSPTRTYLGQFADVPAEAWYYASVINAYERGLMDGKSGRSFDPMGNLTIAEAIKIAAVLHKGYHTGLMDFPQGSPWYAPYLEYALDNGIPVGAYRNLNASATRSDFAVIIAGALPDEALTPINRIADGSIPDVLEIYSYGQAVYKLYRAGVLTGVNSAGVFYPGRTLRRAEAAAIISRIADANTRVRLSLAQPLTAEQIYRLASPAVVFVEAFNEEGVLMRTGSGFFISSSGIAATNYHVVVGASSLRLTTDSGRTINVLGIYDYDRRKDTALIQAEGRGFPYLELADSEKVQTGATVYALGSPLGLQASFSRGIVSQSLRQVEGFEFIQLDAAISSGSSGGALLDTSGRVVGVTSATAVGGQNINLAVPINFYKELSSERYVTFESLIVKVSYYESFFPAPDFGAIFGIELFMTETTRNGTKFSYPLSGFPQDADLIIEDYHHILEQNGFSRSGYFTDDDGVEMTIFYNSGFMLMIMLGIGDIEDTECFTVTVS